MPAKTAAESPREKSFFLAGPETKILNWIAPRLPRRVMPDHMTALGVLAALGIAIAYALSAHDSTWLWAASALLVVHWLGDSLDGTLARVRKTERPKYGYYLDHLVDAIATVMIGIGIGLSGEMLMITGLIVVIAYLVLSINTYLETQAFGVFKLGYGRFGPTEARIGLVAINAIMALGLTFHFDAFGVGFGVLDVIGLGGAALMLGGLSIRAFGNLRELAKLEPARPTPRPA